MNEKYKGDTMLQKTFTEDLMTGKKSKNIGKWNKYYVKDSQPAIFSLKYSTRLKRKWLSARGLSAKRMVHQKLVDSNITANIFWGICLCVVHMEHLIGEGRNGKKWFGDAQRELRKVKGYVLILRH